MTITRGKYIKNVSMVLCAVLLIVMAITVFPTYVHASNKAYKPTVKDYQSSEDTSYQMDSSSSVKSFKYGSPSIGSFTVTGDVAQESTISGYKAYAANGLLVLGYEYDNKFQSGKKEEWNLVSDSGKTINGLSANKKIDKGKRNRKGLTNLKRLHLIRTLKQYRSHLTKN